MSKAGIITFYGADNFGAVLQCYALQKYLSDFGLDTSVVGEKDKAISDFYSVINTKGPIKAKIVSLLQVPSNISRKNKFSKFRKQYLNISKNYNALDLYVCGSDQIWNFNITGGFNPLYFADFHRSEESVVVSYAASIGLNNMPEAWKKTFVEELKCFSAISVREDRAKELIQPLCDKEITVVPDPTLLVKKEEWLKLVKNEKIKKPYVLIYSLNNCKTTYEIAEKAAKSLELPIIEIRGSSKPYKYNSSNTVLDDVGPIEFLSYIKNAEFVVTDSFHGTVFSTLFEKTFYSIPPHGLGSRMETLLKSLGLSSRLVDNWERCSSEKIDYTSVEAKLNVLRKTADDFFNSVTCILEEKNEAEKKLS